MIDELDLAFDEQAEKGRPRHRRAKRGKTGIAFLMAFVLLGALGGGAFFGYNKIKGFFVAADYSGDGGDPVQVQIKQGASLTDMGNSLVDVDVVKSTKAFVNATDDNPKGRNIQPGTYNLRKQMSAANAVKLMLDKKSKVGSGITVPEGKTIMQTYDILAAKTKIPVADFEAAAKDPIALGVQDWWFKRTDGKPVAKTVEGFLYPDTYDFDPSMDASAILSAMVDRFNTVVGDLKFAELAQNNLSISPFEALIVASMTQAESGTAADDGKVARVAYNRLYKAKMPLQFDTTANYWLEINGGAAKHSGELKQSELTDPKNPYNTVTVKGLPVGPIANPGEAALTAAVKPTAGTWLFFVVIDKKGNSAFANTDAEHVANIQRACKAGIPLGFCKK